ncbi:MAG: HAMP domain-containing histidine kinase [Ignavibacteriae bacterium]|nr:HAMP domain-containing histidine kinase [Ignavibacteriota bacterium]
MSIRESIFAKLIALLVIYGILLSIAVVLFLKFSQNNEQTEHNRRILSKMEEVLVEQIGSPPDSVKAREIANDLKVNVQFKYKDANWSTSESLYPIDVITNYPEFRENENDTSFFSFYFKEKMFGALKIEDGIIVVSYYFNPYDAFDIGTVIIAILIHISLFFIPFYFLIKWLLNPIESITNVVKQIGEGNFEVDLKVNREDELGELAESLKNMSLRVKDSIIAKEQLLKDISHELRTPLTRIKFGLELGSPKEKINDDVTEIENMIKKTLDYYRNEFFYLEANLVDINVIPLLQKVIDSFEIYKFRIVFHNFTTNKNSIIIKADEEKLEIALRNLISNALKYSTVEKNILVSIDETKKYYKIGVRDFGVGMKMEDMHKIFEPFSRIDSSRSKKTGGYGLGLAIVKKIVDLHNAVIEVISEEQKGTEMIIKFKKH